MRSEDVCPVIEFFDVHGGLSLARELVRRQECTAAQSLRLEGHTAAQM